MPHQPNTVVELFLDDIDIERRQRRDMGDLARLAESINEVGLLQPIVITTRGILVAGQRRLEAHRLLKRKTILCCVVEDLRGALPLLQAEVTENTCRRPFTPSEAVSAAERLLPLAQEAAQNRIFHRADQGASVNFTEGGQSVDQIAKLLDLSRPTLEKAMKVVAAAREDKEQYGDLVERMDRTGKVNGSYQELLRRQGKLTRRPAAYFTVRLNVNGTFDISGVKNKPEILANLYTLIHEIQLTT